MRADDTEAMSRRLVAAVDSVAEAIEIIDADWKIVYVNRRWTELTGYTEAEAMGRAPSELLRSDAHPADYYAQVEAELRAGRAWRGYFVSARKDGSLIPQTLSVTPLLSPEGALEAIVAVRLDLTEQLAAEQRLRESEERYALASMGANDGLWDWKIPEDEAYFSERWCGIVGNDRQGFSGKVQDWLSLVHPDDLSRLRELIDEHFQLRSPHFESEHRLRHVDGSYRWVQARGLAFRGPEGAAVRFAGSLTDITQRKQAESMLYFAAAHDGLTSLPNRNLFRDRVSQALERVKRNPAKLFAVLYLDLDGFKQVNDGLGHHVGDRLLVGVARRLESCVRAVDTVSRLGGDEFGLLLEELASADEATAAAARIERALSMVFEIEGHHIFISGSIGVVCSDAESTVEQMLRDADSAMYEVRTRGRGGHHVIDAATRERRARRSRLGGALRQSVEVEGLEVVYQPVVSLITGQVRGLEALARWNHPVHGAVPPAEFVPLAEEMGLIDRLGYQVMREACRRAAQWMHEHARDQFFVNVNVSARQFRDPHFVERVAQVQAMSGLRPGVLGLEITETVFVDRPESVVAMLRELRNMGVRLALDDFGTGFSSLSHLRRFPVQSVKIDRSFVSALDADGTTLHIVRAIVSLTHALGMVAVAEGIETLDQVAILRGVGCDLGQGWLFSKATKAPDVSRLMNERFAIQS
ncbi:MAG: EAL domain-containing protein [Deltaproteobacteria bacterium]|nr:EAL domain-containing protein [Deltaproteobacteria bacterium]